MSLSKQAASASTRLDALGDGRLVIIKTATSEQACSRLRKEAATLEIGSMPGVVELVSYTEAIRSDQAETDTGSGQSPESELSTLYVGPQTLDSITEWTLEELVGTLSMLGTTIADLHDLGITHGALTAEHVLVDQQHHPVICGFGHGKVGEPVTADDLAGDVRSLGLITVALMSRVRERTRSAKRALADIERIASSVQASTLQDSSTSARRFATDISTIAVEPAAKSGRSLPAAISTGANRRRTALAIATACSAAGLAAAAWAVFGSGQPNSSAPTPFAATTSSAVTDASGCKLVECPRQLSDGRVAAFGHTYTVGRTGDEVLLANWTCRSDITAAVLRPSTGEVFFFPRWTMSTDIIVPAVARVADARQATITRDPKGCPALAVTTSAGTTSVVHPQEAP
jgi:hypothetical protein